MIVCNFSEEDSKLEIPYHIDKGELLIGNYSDTSSKDEVLRPYECRLYSI
ncbi:MAG: hypothetical protein GX913_05685 [Clostridiales bacterium]|nr:hypothetical protein [Clostridiales bacterium]